MSSDDRRRRPGREERDLAREAAQLARAKAKEAAQAAKAKAKQAAEEAAGEAIEAALAAHRETLDQGHNPFGLLWERDEDGRHAGTRGVGRGRGRGSGLNRDEIVAVALRVAETEGPEAVSMRRLAKELGVGTMSLYHHVPTKDDLLDLMHDQVMGELLIPEDELGETWQDGLLAISRRTRAVYTQHAWMLSGAWERPQFGPRAFAHIEQSLQVMRGVPREKALIMLGAADDFVIGFVSRQVAERDAHERAGLDREQFQEALRPYVEGLLREHAADYPALAEFVDAEWDQDADARFEAGLRWLVGGMAEDVRSGA